MDILVKKLLLTTPLIMLCCITSSQATISEKTLSQFKSSFMARLIGDNPDYENRIRRFMKGMILEGRMGIPLLDKFGLFLSSMEKKGVDITMIRFYGRDERFCLFFVMKDRRDGQLYTMFLEYDYGAGGKCSLRDIYFSIVFEERMKEIKEFFENR
jgi:hypothetical protein